MNSAAQLICYYVSLMNANDHKTCLQNFVLTELVLTLLITNFYNHIQLDTIFLLISNQFMIKTLNGFKS